MGREKNEYPYARASIDLTAQSFFRYYFVILLLESLDFLPQILSRPTGQVVDSQDEESNLRRNRVYRTQGGRFHRLACRGSATDYGHRVSW